MAGRRDAFRLALVHPVAQGLLACALLVPVVATAGQYWATGYWPQSAPLELLFWPGQPWRYAPRIPVWLSMGAMLASYAFGIGWLLQRLTLGFVVLAGVGTLVVSQAAAGVVNQLTGWHELQVVSSMDLAGKANRAIFALWHNPAWEEIVFRGIPLALLLLARRRVPRVRTWAAWCYFVVPAMVFAVYHLPGHGPSRLVDTFTISLAFSWMALRFSFFAPLVMHYVFDAMMTLSLGKLPNIPRAEVAWLADHASTLNTSWSVLLLLWLLAIAAGAVVRWHAASHAGGSAPSGGGG